MYSGATVDDSDLARRDELPPKRDIKSDIVNVGSPASAHRHQLLDQLGDSDDADIDDNQVNDEDSNAMNDTDGLT